MQSTRTNRWWTGVLAGGLLAGTVAAGAGTAQAAAPSRAPTMYVGDVHVTEGEIGTGVARVPITLSAPLAADAYFTVRTLDDGKGNATPTEDYRPKQARKRLRAGATSMTFAVPIFSDTNPEPLERLAVQVEAIGAPPIAVVKPIGSVVIADEDSEHGDLAPDGASAVLSASVTRLHESDIGKAAVPVTFRLSAPQPADVAVTWKAAEESAAPGTDFKPMARTTIIKAGRVHKTVRLPMYHDETVEADEQMRIVVTGVAGGPGVVISDDPMGGMVYMLDDDADTDTDGLEDSAELFVKTNPFVSDTDGDGLVDGDEVRAWFTNPHAVDTDGDGFGDLLELKASTDPLDAGDHPDPTP